MALNVATVPNKLNHQGPQYHNMQDSETRKQAT